MEQNNNSTSASRNETTTRNGTTTSGGMEARNAITSLFDMGSVIYSIPRTVLLNPNTDNTISNRRRNGKKGQVNLY